MTLNTKVANMPRASLKLNASMNLLKVLASIVFPIITYPYTSRILGPEGVGTVNYAFSYASYLTFLASLGIPMYGMREVAKYRDDSVALTSLCKELIVIHFVATLIISSAYTVLVLCSPIAGKDRVLFLVASLMIPASLFSVEWIYQGTEKYVYMTIRSVIISAVSTVAIFVFVKIDADYEKIAIITVAAAVVTALFNFYNAKKILFSQSSGVLNFRRHFKFLRTVFLLNFGISIYLQVDTIILGLTSNPTQIGYYSASIKLVRLLVSLVVSIGSTLVPRLSWYVATEQTNQFDRVLRNSMDIALLLCIPLTVGLMIMSQEIIQTFAGGGFISAATCLQVAAPIIILISASNILGIQILYPLGKEFEVAVIVGIGATSAIVLYLILVPRFGAIGTSIGTLVAEGVVFVLSVIRVQKHHPITWPWKNIARVIISVAMMGASCEVFRNSVDTSSDIVRLVSCVTVGGIVYFGSLYVLKHSMFIEMIHAIRKNSYG